MFIHQIHFYGRKEYSASSLLVHLTCYKETRGIISKNVIKSFPLFFLSQPAGICIYIYTHITLLIFSSKHER